MVGVSVLLHGCVGVYCWTAPLELPGLMAPQVGKTSILLRASEAARPKPSEMVFQKSLAELPPMVEVVQPKAFVPQLEAVIRPRQTAQAKLPDLKTDPILRTLPEVPDLEPFTLPVAKAAKGFAMAGPAANWEATLARPKAPNTPIPELRPEKTMVPPLDLPPLEPLSTPLITVKATTIPPPAKTSKDGPESLPKPVAKEATPKLEAVTKIADLVALPSEASEASRGATVDELPRKLPINPAPDYPTEALAAGREGNVMLRVRIDASGKVAGLSLYASSGVKALDESALFTVRTWVFAPARRAGQAIPYEVLVPIEFSIRRRS